MTEDELKVIEDRAGKATPGPWVIDRELGTPWNVETKLSGAAIALTSQLLNDDRRQSRRSANTEFIAHAREDVPVLIAEVRRLRKVVEAAVELRAAEERHEACRPVVPTNVSDWRFTAEHDFRLAVDEYRAAQPAMVEVVTAERSEAHKA